ncbi:MAG: ribosomal protein S18-alanine N-acetyltransferase [Terriglobales bacterium]
MPLSIRDAVADDLPAILVIEQASPSAAHWSVEQYQSRLGEAVVIVADEDARICGFLCARVVAGEWEVENVVVDGRFRRRGLGAALMRAVFKKWEAAGGTAVYLEVRESNAAARALYKKCGLGEVGRRRQYYKDPVEDAVLYARHPAA